MKKSIFREKNIDRINSPESLNDYVKVTNPSVWIVLIAIIVLLAGAAIWGIFGNINTTLHISAEAKKGEITLYVDENDVEGIHTGMTVNVEGNACEISSIADRPVNASEVDGYVLHKGNLETAAWVYPVSLRGSLEDGVYEAAIVVEQVSPISFLFN